MEIVLIIIGIVVVILIAGGVDNNRPVSEWSDQKLMRMHGKLLHAARTAQEAGNFAQAQQRADKAAEVEDEIRRRVQSRDSQGNGSSLAWGGPRLREDHPDAVFMKAQAYRLGQGVEKDTAKAFQMIKQLAEQGHLDSQNMLGFMLGNGEGAEVNHDEQYRWLLAAAERGHSTAQANLGILLAEKHSSYNDYEEAVKWLTAAAEQGEEFAQERLAEMYCNGEGVQVDYAEAEKWCQLAANQGSFSAEHMLGIIRYRASRVSE
jgi:TPR repeat protein